jgi:hypothetical protein
MQPRLIESSQKSLYNESSSTPETPTHHGLDPQQLEPSHGRQIRGHQPYDGNGDDEDDDEDAVADYELALRLQSMETPGGGLRATDSELWSSSSLADSEARTEPEWNTERAPHELRLDARPAHRTNALRIADLPNGDYYVLSDDTCPNAVQRFLFTC